MRRSRWTWVPWVLLLTGMAPASVSAQPATVAPNVATATMREMPVAESADVRLRGEVMFAVDQSIGELSVDQRAKAIEARLAEALAQPELDATMLRVEQTSESSDIFLGEQFVTSVTDADASLHGRTRQQRAADIGMVLRAAVLDDMAGRSMRGLMTSAVRSVAVIVMAILLVFGLRWIVARLQRRIAVLAQRKIPVIHVLGFTLLSPARAIPFTLRSLHGLRWLLTLVVLVLVTGYVLGQFPWTQGVANTVSRSALSSVRWVASGIAGFVPNLVFIITILVVTRYLLRGLRMVLERLGASDEASNFAPELVEPTFQIVRFVVIALALVVAFPYLPGSGSKAFQGVSVFVGLMVSLGSSAAIGNMVAGIVLIYMQILRPGDRVKIADTVGDVISCDLLALKVRTVKNVTIAIPNVLALANPIINFSTEAANGRLILHTSVTIGYDVEWKTVHALLIKAALATRDIEPEPAPFVLQTSLDDFYVAYEINAHTKHASAMARIYSDLHANIQDKFNEGGVEILSPHYGAMRDGSRTAVPDQYLPKNYRPATFGLSLFRQRAGDT